VSTPVAARRVASDSPVASDHNDRVPNPREHAFLDHATPIAMAHRGGATTPANIGLENSLRAFRTAARLGYRYLETDVHVSRDGVLFAFHDDRLDRVTDRRGVVCALDAAEVALARIGGTEPIPTLVQLFEEFPAARINIDVKTDAAVEPVVRLVRATGTLDRVCLAAFSSRRVLRMRRLLGRRLATSMGSAEIAWLRSAPLAAARRMVVRYGAACVQVPHRAGPITVASDSFVEHCHDIGLPVHVWTVDDPNEMRLLLDRGVDGLIADRIDLLKEVLLERGTWNQATA